MDKKYSGELSGETLWNNYLKLKSHKPIIRTDKTIEKGKVFFLDRKIMQKELFSEFFLKIIEKIEENNGYISPNPDMLVICNPDDAEKLQIELDKNYGF